MNNQPRNHAKARDAMVIVATLMIGAAVGAGGVWMSLHDTDAPRSQVAETCAPPFLAWLPDDFHWDANQTRDAPLLVVLNPWMPWKPGGYPAVNWSLVQAEAKRLYDADVTVLPGDGPGGDVLVQHEKLPFHGRAGELLTTGAVIIVTWNTTLSLEATIVHELGHALGLDHHPNQRNVMYDGLDRDWTGGADVNSCQWEQLRHVHHD